MFILGTGRRVFLEFLRNLTSQILFFALAFVAASKLVIPSFDLANAGPTLVFFSLLAIAVLAAIANITLFMSESIAALKLREGLPTASSGGKSLQLIHSNLKFAWTKRWPILEVIVVLLIVEFSFVAVVINAIGAATSLLEHF